MFITLLVFGAIGHAILWVALVNRVHALGINRRWIDLFTLACGAALVLIPLVVGAVLADLWETAPPPTLALAASWSYVLACAAVAMIALGLRLRLLLHPERRGVIQTNHTSHIDLRNTSAESLAAPGIWRMMSSLPGNEALSISIHEKELIIPRLCLEHDGLRVAHLSDLHMSGRIKRAYFEQVVEHVNRAEPDLVAITGDLLERDICIEWIPETLGRLRATGGVYYVLGNHDQRVDAERRNAALANSGLKHLGGTWIQVTIRNAPIVLAGDELPWHGPEADLHDCPTRDARGRPLRVLLAHSPDRFRWAQQQDIDLMLAGHNHGGQVRFPVLGPIFAPSHYGVRYACGAFSSGPTIMHVSRGTSSLTPLRYNCPPEIAILILRRGL